MTPGGLGRVQTQRVVLFDQDDPLVLESGATVAPVEVAYETYGTLDQHGVNAVFVCHALTGDAHAAGHHGDPQRRGWWDNLIGPGRPIDTERLFVICPNLLGGCQGTTGPSSIDHRTARPYGLEFPMFTVRDLTRVHRRLLTHLGVERVHLAIGGSLGGMQALQWALDHPRELQRAAVICASARLSAQNIALSAVAREAIMSDPAFASGHYLETGRRPSHGLAIARMIGHITYLSQESMRRKFDRARRVPDAPMTFSEDFEVEHYLAHQGESFLRRFDALSYLYLSRTMDYFDPFSDPALDLAAVRTRFLVLSFDTDWRFSSEHSAHLTRELRRGGVDAEHVEIQSPWGHDSFLLEVPEYHRVVARFAAEPAPVPTAGISAAVPSTP
ncbi:MAG: homoserine O-acetyltransferase MetX [Solirubrobacteraceae bacterium]